MDLWRLPVTRYLILKESPALLLWGSLITSPQSDLCLFYQKWISYLALSPSPLTDRWILKIYPPEHGHSPVTHHLSPCLASYILFVKKGTKMREKEISSRRESPWGSSNLAKCKMGEYTRVLKKCWINQLFHFFFLWIWSSRPKRRFFLLRGVSTMSTTQKWGIWGDGNKGIEE